MARTLSYRPVPLRTATHDMRHGMNQIHRIFPNREGDSERDSSPTRQGFKLIYLNVQPLKFHTCLEHSHRGKLQLRARILCLYVVSQSIYPSWGIAFMLPVYVIASFIPSACRIAYSEINPYPVK